MSSERQTFFPWILVAAFLISAATLSFSRPNLGLRHDHDGNVTLEWSADTGTLYAVYWTASLTERWHLLGEVSAETSAVALADMEGINRPAVSNSDVQARYYAVRKVIPTVVSSDVTTGTVWMLMASPYVLTNQVNVCDGAILTIEPGVVVQGEAGGALVVGNGGLRVLGTTNEMVSFKSVRVVFEDQAVDADCVLSNAIIEGAGLVCRSSSPAIVSSSIRMYYGCGVLLENSSPMLLGCEIGGFQAGGIHCDASSPTIRNCRVSYNFKNSYEWWKGGAGIACENGSDALIEGCRIERNTAASWGGGGIFCRSSSPTIRNCVIVENQGGEGAGVYLWDSKAVITGCEIKENGYGSYYYTSVRGGGVFCKASDPELYNCTIRANNVGWYLGGHGDVSGFGGGVYADTNSNPSLRCCSLYDNTAVTYGGGVYVASSNTLFENCLIARNLARNSGGGVYCAADSPILRNCTIAYNSADGVIGGAPFLQNCIIWGNSGTQISGYSEFRNCLVQGLYPPKDPKFVSGSYHLASGSPCIDAGDPVDAPGIDIEGTTRQVYPLCTNGISAIDIGAYEYVDSDADGLADFWEMHVFSNLSHDATTDLDDDGLTDVEESDAGTDPNAADTDGDGLLDGDEVKSRETSPLKPDTDGDGYDDGDEVSRGSDPLNMRDIPYTPHVVINEVMYYPTNQNAWRNQFIELFNPCDHEVDLEDWSLTTRQFDRTKTAVRLSGLVMGPTSYYLIGGPYVVSADGHLPDAVLDPGLKPLKHENASVVELCLNSADGEPVDGVLYGKPAPEHIADDFPEACSYPPQPTVPCGWSISRVVDGQDRNRTSDWCALESPTPRGTGASEVFDPEDLDRDGLTVGQELILGTDPEDADSDGDGLLDGDEVTGGSDPTSFESDGDGINDDEEVGMGLNPAAKDTDGDGLWDSTELSLGSDPRNADSDGDDVLDGAEDSDGDGITDEDEQAFGSIPKPIHTMRSTRLQTGGINGGRVSLDMESYDKRSGNGFLQDFLIEKIYHFYDLSAPVVVFLPLEMRKGSNHSYRVTGASLVRSNKSVCVYATEIPVSGKTITVTEYLIDHKWPAILHHSPSLFDVSIDNIAPPDQQSPGAIVLLNDDDDDLDGTNDFEDAHVPVGDDELIPVRISHPPEMGISIDWDNSMVHLYEHPSKKLHDRGGRGWIWNAAVGACYPHKPYKGYDDQVVYLEGVKPGVTWMTVRCGTYQRRIKVTVIQARLLADYNHDRKIDHDDAVMKGTGTVFRFWANDDDDQTADSGDDIPGRSHPDAGNGEVDSVRDLVDFFPVFLDMTNILAFVDETNFAFRLNHNCGFLNFVRTDLTPLTAGQYLTDADVAESIATQSVSYLTGLAGVDPLDEAFLQSIERDGRGIVLAEARSPGKDPLDLSMWRRGMCIAQWKLPLSISGVEEMYRWINLRPSGGLPNSTGEPTNNPDSVTNGKNVFFMHGFNVAADEARGWNAELFKRLYWSGSKAKFWGMTWEGDVGLINGLHYQEDVANALAVASNFFAQVSGITGEKIILAHSLGNMVVSGAIQDYGLNVNKYFMLNAAVATECYRPASFNDATAGNYMLHKDWPGYSNRTWCSKWFELFSLLDDRAKLTWKNRFPAVASVAYNFYSSGDEIFQVFSNGTPSAFNGGPFHLEQFAWQKQEQFKGRTILGIPVLGGTDWAGWGFSGEYTMAEANAATTNDLQTKPVFRQKPTMMLSSNITVQVVNDIIAQGVPALSCAAGVNAITLMNFYNYNVNDHKQNGWGRSGSLYYDRWLHSDLKDMAYLYTYEFFNELVSQGGLQ